LTVVTAESTVMDVSAKAAVGATRKALTRRMYVGLKN
jgi:hypothetical protein